MSEMHIKNKDLCLHFVHKPAIQIQLDKVFWYLKDYCPCHRAMSSLTDVLS